MALIKTTPPEEAEGKLKELYDEAREMFGVVPNNVQLLGVSPEILDNQLQFAMHFRGHPTLSLPLLAMIRMLVSKACKSPYCQSLNTGLLMKAGFKQEDIMAMQADPTKAPLDEKSKGLLLFTLKATDDPHSVTQADVDSVRALGWSDQEIFEAVAHGSRMVGTNILFDAFKIEKDF